MTRRYMNDVTLDCKYTFGECIISRSNFQKIKDNFNGDAARNAVAGVFRRDYISEDLSVVDFIRYGVVDKTKSFAIFLYLTIFWISFVSNY